MRRLLSLAVLTALAVAPLSASADPQAIADAALRASPVIDGHNDLPWRLRMLFKGASGGVDLRDTAASRAAGLDTDIPRLRQGGVGGQFWSLWVPGDLHGPAATAAVIRQIDLTQRLIARYPKDLAPAFSADDVVKAQAEGRVASLMGVEGGAAIDDSLETLRQLYRLGARYMTLTHFDDVDWADSSNGKAAHGGLTPFGKAVVQEMNRLGMLVDLSHVAATTMNAALDVSAAPVIFSHSSARALADHPRNVDDAVLRRVAANGGVVMANMVPPYISEAVRRWTAEQAAEQARQASLHPGDQVAADRAVKAWTAAHPRPAIGMKDWADHIDHIRAIAGVDHVGLGADFGDADDFPDGVSGVDAYRPLVAELARRGWSQADLGKLTGGNILRVMRDVEAIGRRISAERPAGEATIEALDRRP